MDYENERTRIALAQSLAIKGRRFVLVCGSGVSRDADVLTGWDVLLETIKELRYYREGVKKLDYSRKQMETYYNENYKDLTYSEIISQVYPCLEDQRLISLNGLESFKIFKTPFCFRLFTFLGISSNCNISHLYPSHFQCQVACSQTILIQPQSKQTA